MTYTFNDPSPDYPDVVINNAHGAYAILTDSDGDVLPIVDAFCQGYAEAILFANAYHEVVCDECGNAPDMFCRICGTAGYVLESDDDAQYAYQSPGKWWEGMGIDFSDAIDFLAAHLADLHMLADTEIVRDENRFYTIDFVRWNMFEQHGHDFALSRNGHGAGFWDRGYGEVGDRLTEAARAYGEHSVLTDDGPTVTTL